MHSKTFMNSRFVKHTPKYAGCSTKYEAAKYEVRSMQPQIRIIWLGVEIDFEGNTYVITETRIESILNIIENVLSTSYIIRLLGDF